MAAAPARSRTGGWGTRSSLSTEDSPWYAATVVIQVAKLFLSSRSNGQPESGKPRISIRTHLVLLVFAAVLPLLIFGAVMFWRDVALQRAAIEQGMRATAHALSLAFDREVGTAQGVLETLAVSNYLDTRNFEAFYRLCRTVVETRKNSRIILFDGSGQQIINTGFRFGEALPNPLRDATASEADPAYPELSLGGPDSVKAIIETGRSVVSDLFVALSTRRPTVVIGALVRRDGEVLYVLEMSIEPQVLWDLLMEQQLPSNWFASVMDRKGMIIARTRDPELFVGRPATAEQVEQIAKSEGGWGTRRDRQGDAIEYAFTRSKVTGWTTDVAVPQAVIYDPVNHSIRVMAGGAGLLVILALGAAVALGRRISTPIQRLAGSAEAIQRGEQVTPDYTPVLPSRSSSARDSLAPWNFLAATSVNRICRCSRCSVVSEAKSVSSWSASGRRTL